MESVCPARDRGFKSLPLRILWFVYAIGSIKFDFRYIGMSQNPEFRLKMHNSGKVRSTKHYRPFKLIYTEEIGSRAEAREREKYLKSAAGRRYLGQLLQ